MGRKKNIFRALCPTKTYEPAEINVENVFVGDDITKRYNSEDNYWIIESNKSLERLVYQISPHVKQAISYETYPFKYKIIL